MDINKICKNKYEEISLIYNDASSLEYKEIPKYDKNTQENQLDARKNRILNNINNFGIKWFYNFDMCLFFSIGFNILK